MREWISYLGEIVLITAVSGLLYTVSPEGNLKKHLQFVISLCLVVSLAVPMFSTIMELPEIFEKSFEEAESGELENESALTDSLISVSKKEIEGAIASYIAGKYAIEESEISVETVLDAANPESIEIREIYVVISGEYLGSFEKIRSDLDEMFLGKSRVSVEREE